MAESNQIQCPHCGQSYFVQPGQWAQYHGQTINCTKCGKPFAVTAPAEMLGAAGSAPTVQQGVAAIGPLAYDRAFPPPPPFPGGGGGGQQYGAYPGAGMYPPRPVGTSGWAIASLVFGIVSFCVPVIGSFGAIGTAIGGLLQTRERRTGGRGLAIAGLVLGLFTLVVVLPIQVSVLLPALSRAREQANRVKCAANMRALGMSMIVYGETHGNKFPGQFEDLALMSSPTVLPGNFVCPDDDKTPPAGAPPARMAADISGGQHTSYVYVGAGLLTDAPDAGVTILLYEPLGDHHREGMNVLFVDGHVEWVKAEDAQSILDQRAKGGKVIKLGGDAGGGVSGK